MFRYLFCMTLMSASKKLQFIILQSMMFVLSLQWNFISSIYYISLQWNGLCIGYQFSITTTIRDITDFEYLFL